MTRSNIFGLIDGVNGAVLRTLATTDATCLASLHHNRALILRYARYEDCTLLRPLLAKLDNLLRTSRNASAARSTLLGINLSQAGLGIDVDRIELTSRHAVAIAQATVSTTRLANI